MGRVFIRSQKQKIVVLIEVIRLSRRKEEEGGKRMEGENGGRKGTVYQSIGIKPFNWSWTPLYSTLVTPILQNNEKQKMKEKDTDYGQDEL